jgi:Protein of unknown function (DUF3011)
VRAVGMLVGMMIAASAVTGCVVDPYYNDRYDGRYNRPFDNDYYRPPPKHRHDDDHDRGDYKLPTVVCASKNGRPNRCHTDFAIQRAEVDKRYSGSPCEYGRSWGYDRNEIWVDRGCRARFVVTPAGRWR